MKINTNNNTAKITLDFKCNSYCLFCCELSNRYLPAKTTVEAKKEISIARQKGFTRLILSGGEPAIRPDIFELINFAKNLSFGYVMISTNGQMFSYLDFARKIIDSGISEIVFSLHGHQAKIHDFLTGSPSSFYQLKKGIENLNKLRFNNIGVNTTIVRQNYCYLPQIAKILLKWQIRRFEIVYSTILLKKIFKPMTPKISHAAPYIYKALEIGNKKEYFWRIRNVPMSCYFERYWNRLCWSDRQESTLFLKTHIARLIHRAIEKRKKIWVWVKINKCKFCNYQKRCPGIWQEYIKQYGDKEIKPIT